MLKRSPPSRLAALAIRLPPVAASLMGAAGVALAAMAAHLPDAGNLALASSFLLFHAPAVLALAAFAPRSPAIRLAQAGLIAGPALFATALAVDVLAGIQMEPSPAPFGGALAIAAWLLAAGAFLRGEPKS